jgi:pimeloyl-ACP methyl ester carboxylesterase
LLVAGNRIQHKTTAADYEKYPAPGKLVGVESHQMHIFCMGEGSPTVIADAGNGDFSLSWGLVLPDVVQLTRICVYDRAGYGWSKPSPTPRTAHQMATELHTLLVNAEVEGPYILVGHSLGGLVVRMYSSLYPEEVVGMVLVDAAHEESLTRYPAEVYQILQQQDRIRSVMGLMARFGVFQIMGESVGALFIPEHIKLLPADQQKMYLLLTSNPDYFAISRAEMQSMAESCEQVSRAGDLRNLPLVIVAAAKQIEGAPDDFPVDVILATAKTLQEDLATLSTNSTYIVADGSGHNIHFDRPDLVSAAIRQILDQSHTQASH